MASIDPADQAASTVAGGDDVLVVRHLGGAAERSRTFVQAVWRLLRPALLGRPAVPPRIWAT
jgi:urease accessory protein